jgi:superfamily II RNA helicase
MVVICNTAYPAESKYESHFGIYPYPLSDFQKYAIEGIVEGNHVLVTAHTGSGKTLPAEFAIRHFTSMGKKVIYTSPIKALSNQKFYEFTKKYPEISFGLFTGDIKTNPNADVIIMTTEILMNYLFVQTSASTDNKKTLDFQIDIQNELACVVFDEVHYINDQERGQVWEKTILMLPEHIQMVMLSATIDNPEGFAKWCERGNEYGKKVYLASTNHRVVPLTHYGFITTNESIFKIIKDKDIQKEIRDNTNKLIMLQNEKGDFQESGYRNIVKINKLLEATENKRKHVLNQLALFLRDREMLPAIAFVFSRKNVEKCAKDITVVLLEDDSKIPYIVRRECEQIIRKLPNYQEYLELPEYNELVSLLEKGVGIHHSGMIPVLREIVELMISKKYIKLLFATESFAIGLDCPIKTAIFTSLTKFDGNNERHLMAHEYTQMAGRAGRRGIDTIGHIVHCNNLFTSPSLMEYKKMLGGVPQKLVSKYHISYPLILNLLKNGQTNNFDKFSEKSMIHQELLNSIDGQSKRILELQDQIAKKNEIIHSMRTPYDTCLRFKELDETVKTLTNKKRKDAEREIKKIQDEHRTLSDDMKKVRDYVVLTKDLENEKASSQYATQYIETQTRMVCNIMVNEGFIYNPSGNNDYHLTDLGNLATNIAEVHPLIITKLLIKTDHFANFTTKQLIGLFSCFTDIKIPSQMRSIVPKTDDTLIKNNVSNLIEMYNHYENLELENGIQTGLKYNDALMFDMIDFSMQWCDCDTEEKCKYFIQAVISEKSISIGDFTKAMLKIITITKEIMNVCEMIGSIELLHKLNSIESIVLKYVLTSQSLYV